MTASRSRIYWIAGLAALIGVIADQVSKWAMIKIIGARADHIIHVLPVFDLVLWWNNGTSFSMFRTNSAWGPYVFSLTALAIVGGLVLWLSRITSPILAAALGAVIGGAIGNVVDRWRFGAVADFLYWHIGDYGWPAFNLADSLIVVGVGILVLDGMFVSHKTDKTGRRKQP
jgi:signal peptidase II